MYAYIEAFNAYLEQNKCNCGYPNVSTVLELLYSRYQQNKGMDAAQVKAYYDELYKTAEKAVPGSGEEVISAVHKFCREAQRQAFLEGVTVGFRLYNELYKRQR